MNRCQPEKRWRGGTRHDRSCWLHRLLVVVVVFGKKAAVVLGEEEEEEEEMNAGHLRNVGRRLFSERH